MKYKSIIFPAFIIMALVQLYVPASMIWSQESILKEGEAFKFRTAPVDPYDPFRGKYVTLNFSANEFVSTTDKDWMYGQRVYVSLGEDNEGYARILSLSETEPQGSAYVRASVLNQFDIGEGRRVTIRYPFNRFYMDEFKAYEAELGYREAQRDTTQVAYALVKVKAGEAVLENVFINDEPLADVARRRLSEPEK